MSYGLIHHIGTAVKEENENAYWTMWKPEWGEWTWTDGRLSRFEIGLGQSPMPQWKSSNKQIPKNGIVV